MLNSISLWAVLTTSIIAPITTSQFSVEDNTPETSINRVEATRTDFVPQPIPVTVPAKAQISFEREGVTSTPKPKPVVKKETKPAPELKTAAQETINTKTATPTASSVEQAPKNQAPTLAAAPAAPAVSVAPGSSQDEAARQVAARGWGAGELTCLINLWEKESNWNHLAANPSSGAYGIPQSLPGNKMASAGADWQTNPATQIKWGLGYIAERYQTPCGAWGHSVAVGWY